MKAESARWVQVTPSRYPHEREGVEHVRDNLPDATPYRAWSNFEFVALDGTPYEVDLLVLGPAGLHLVELKAWAGRISGDERDWWEQGSRNARPPSHDLTEWVCPQAVTRCRTHARSLWNSFASASQTLHVVLDSFHGSSTGRRLAA